MLRIFLALLASAACAVSSAQALKPWPGGDTPPLALEDLDGRRQALADYRGRVVLVNFWATWCEPCRAEMPSIERLRRTLAGRPFAVLAVNVGEGPAAARRFIDQVQAGFPVLLDRDASATRAWRARVLPATYLVGPDGAIRYAHYGELNWSSPALQATVESLMPRQPLAVLAQAGQGLEVAPFITTPDSVVERMLRFAATGPADYVMDLGSGDGRIVIAAASLFGARAGGIELDKELVERSRDNARRAGVAQRTEFIHGDVLVADISRASVVTVYLLPSLIDRLQPRFLAELRPGTRIVSHAFGMVGWRPDRSETLRVSTPHPGQGDFSTIYLWVVPADLRGEWRADDAAGSWRLRIHQNYQEVELEGTRDGRGLKFADAALAGSELTWRSDAGSFRGRLEGRVLRGELAAPGGTQPLVLRRAR